MSTYRLRQWTAGFLVIVAFAAAGAAAADPSNRSASDADSAAVAARVDTLILKQLQSSGVQAASLADDEDFLRRVSLDIAGSVPTARDVTLFGLDPDPAKRTRVIDRLLDSREYAETWARYWRDVILTRATNVRARLVNDAFLSWMTEALQQNQSWDEITTALLTATGDVRETGQTVLFFAHEGDPNEVAGEVSRIFLGIQMQCANCHNHPWDRWKREQFHELAAFFPRVSVRRTDPNDLRSYEVASFNARFDRGGMRGPFMENPERLFQFADRNRDGKLTKAEVGDTPLARIFDFALQRGDKNNDGGLSMTELKELPPPPVMPGRGQAEHFMPDLNNPSVPGEKVDPRFFVTGEDLQSGLDDMARRTEFAKLLTSSRNEWFAKALVNRLWAEFTGQGFYMPVDDMGPDRKPTYPEVLDLLATEFTQHAYDVKWLIRTIVLTQAYQRKVQSQPATELPASFAAASATRLRADQLYSSLVTVLGGAGDSGRAPPRVPSALGPFGPRSPRDAFAQLFAFDPSTPQEDITGSIPQALFMMNSPQIASQVRADSGTRLAELLRRFPDDSDALQELYLLILSRQPSDKELRICHDYIQSVGQRQEAYEDLMWSLLNSSEFLSKR